MADRLAELLRQRALLQEHVAWLDREIAAASNQPAPVASVSAAAQPVPAPFVPTPAALPSPAALATVPTSAVTTEATALGEDILEQYRVPAQTLQTDVRKGCLLYFFAGLALLAAGIAILYVAFRH
jgi:hypothetical protein